MRAMEPRSVKTAAITPEGSQDDLCRCSRWGVREENTLNGAIQQCVSSKASPQRSPFIHQNHRTTINQVCQHQIITCPAACVLQSCGCHTTRHSWVDAIAWDLNANIYVKHKLLGPILEWWVFKYFQLTPRVKALSPSIIMRILPPSGQQRKSGLLHYNSDCTRTDV